MRYRRGIILGLSAALLGVCALMAGAVALSVAQFTRAGVRFQAISFDRVSAEATEEKRFTLGEPGQLVVDNAGGAVTVVAADTTEVVVSLHKTAWAANAAAAQADLDALQVSFDQQGDRLTIRYQQPNQVVVVGSTRSDTVDLTLTVPRQMAVDLRANFGDVRLEGVTGAAILKTDFGQITVADTTGPLTAQTNSGTVTARRVQAGEGAIELRSDFGAVMLEDAAAGRLGLHSSSGKITATQVTVPGQVSADTDFGPITLRAVSGAGYDLRTNSGAITVAGAAGTLLAHTDFGDIAITDALSVTLDLKTNSGQIDFTGSLGQGPHTVKTDFGAVTLALPEATALTVDLSTDFGQITSAFPILVTGELSRQSATRFSGPLNGGGEQLTVHTNSGNVTLEILK
ncbi:MAG: DUF4097 family beta strand repeat protein [Anaerolineales bacterium]|nr:DUF4097 family beta strand repeat protein [Anaerolineales bacterium]